MRWEQLKKEEPDTFVKINKEVDGVSEWVWRSNDHGGEFMARDWPYLRDTLLKHTNGRDLIVQAGGNCGMYPRLWSKYFKTVHTFEPVDDNFFCLCENCPSDDIHKHRAALGEFEGFVRMMGGTERYSDTNEKYKNAGVYWVQGIYDSGVYQMPLDKLKLPHVDLIQLDVERYETRVLKGAIETIKRYKPTISIETYDIEAQEFMAFMGYTLVDRAANDYVLTAKP